MYVYMHEYLRYTVMANELSKRFTAASQREGGMCRPETRLFGTALYAVQKGEVWHITRGTYGSAQYCSASGGN